MTSCDQVRAQLDDHLSGRLPTLEAAAIAGHLARCADCRAESERRARLAAAARALPREIAPDRDLWPDIAARLAGAAPDARAPRAHPWLARRARPLSTAGLLAAAGLAAVLLWPSALPVPDARRAPLPDVADLDASYRTVRAGLDRVLASRCDELPASTCDAVRGSIADLDQSAASLAAALRAGGGRADAVLLVNSYEMTIDRARGLTTRLVRL